MKYILFSLLLISTPLAATAVPKDCDEFANVMTTKVMKVFHDKDKNEDDKRAILSSMFEEAVDTDWIGKFVLGRFWNKATPEEQTEFLKSYRTYLTNIYISKFKSEDGDSIESIKLISTKPVGEKQFQAKTLIQSKNEADIEVDYLLSETPQKCQVHDIKVENISLLSSQRSEFGSLANRSGVKGVIDAMHKQLGSN